MSYTKQTWADAPSTSSPLSAARLTHMEEGIEAAAATADLAAPASRKINEHDLTADVTLTKSDVGLGVVDNTSDANKPVSTATAAALANKVAGSVNGTATGLTLWTGTADQFDAVTTKDDDTVYVTPDSVSIGGAVIISTRKTAVSVTVDHTKVGATNLVGFPLYVDLSDMPDQFWNTVTGRGGNIRCYAGTTELSREVVSCNAVTKTGELHIKCDLSATVDTVITIVTDGTLTDYAATNPLGAQAVWSDYSLVSHDGGITDTLGNVPNLSAWVEDPGSSPKTYTLTENEYKTPQSTTGLLGAGGGSYFAAIDSGLRYEATAKAVAQVSLWAKPTNNTSTQIIADLRQTNTVGQLIPANQTGFPYLVSSNGSGVTLTSPWFKDGVAVAGAGPGPMNINTWNHVVIQARTAPGLLPLTLILGQAAASTFYYAGLIDEVRLCDIARTPAWIAAEYANQSNPGTFYTIATTAVPSTTTAVKDDARLVVVGDNGNGSTRAALTASIAGTGEMYFNIGANTTNVTALWTHWTTEDTGTPGTTTQKQLDTDPAGPITFSASLQVVSSSNPATVIGKLYRLTFGGRTSVTLDPGGRTQADLLGLSLRAGDVIAIRTFLASGTAAAPMHTLSTSGGFTATSDLTAAGSAAIPKVTGNYYGPSAVLGYPEGSSSTKSVLLVGDSIGDGAGDSAYITRPGINYGGIVPRALRGRAGLLNLAVGGDRAEIFLTTDGSFRRLSLANLCTTAIIENGANDFGLGGRTDSQLRSDQLATATMLRRLGIGKVFLTTLPPRTTSTDGWATTANQKPIPALESYRLAYNAWVRARCPIDPITKSPVTVGTIGAVLAGSFDHPITGIFDTGGRAESSLNSGFWQPAVRVAAGSITAGSAILDSVTGNFLTANQEDGGDKGTIIGVLGAGSGGAVHNGNVIAINSSTQVRLNVNAATTVTDAQINIGIMTADGIHPSPRGHHLMSQAIDPALL